MAIIENVNKIIIYSYSPVNNNFYKKIAKYSEATSIKHEVYDDENLEEIILKYKDKDWFSSYINLDKNYTALNKTINKKANLSFKAYINDKFKDKLTKKIKVYLGEILTIELQIINPTSNTKKIEIDYSNFKNELFECLNHDIKKTLNISPHSSVIDKLYLKIIKYVDKYSLPKININKETLTISDNISVIWSTCPNFIGQKSKKALENCLNIINAFNCLNYCLIKGPSGTGKSKILKEVKNIIQIQNNIKCFYFDSDNNIATTKFFCQSLLEFFTNFQLLKKPEKNKAIFKDIYLDDNNNNNNLYEIMFNKNFDFKNNLDNLARLFFYYLQKDYYVLILENIQKYDNDILTIIEKINNLANLKRVKSTIFFSINTSNLNKDSKINEFLENYNYYCLHNNNYDLIELENFDRCFAKQYIIQSLNLDNASYLTKTIDNIIDNIGTNPLTLQDYLINYQKDNGPSLMYSNILTNYEKNYINSYNYKYIYNNIDNYLLKKLNKDQEKKYYNILGLMCLLKSLNYKIIKKIIGEDIGVIELLINNNIIYKLDNMSYNFRHNNLINYFSKYIDKIEKNIVELLDEKEHIETLFILNNKFNKTTFEEFKRICEKISHYDIDKDNLKFIYDIVLNLCKDNNNIFPDLIKTFNSICNNTTYFFGISESLPYLKNILEIIFSNFSYFNQNYDEIANIIKEYLHNLMHKNQYSDVSEYINKLIELKIKFSDDNYNRQFKLLIYTEKILLCYKTNELEKALILSEYSIINLCETELEKASIYMYKGNSYYNNFTNPNDNDYIKNIIENWNNAYELIKHVIKEEFIKENYSQNAKIINIIYRKVLSDILANDIDIEIINYLFMIKNETGMVYFEIKIRQVLSLYYLLSNRQNGTKEALNLLIECIDILNTQYKNIKMYNTTLFYIAQCYRKINNYNKMEEVFLNYYKSLETSTDFFTKKHAYNDYLLIEMAYALNKYNFLETNSFKSFFQIIKEKIATINKTTSKLSLFYDAENDINYPLI